MPELPTGTVTFLFTDLEGSTRLWEDHGEAMRRAVARHDELLRQAIASHGGHVFKTGGDAFCAAFGAAPEALAAALAAQLALATEAWDKVGSLRARMALHTGTAEERDQDYFGSAPNRAARLLAIGHGGQTLLSHSTAELLLDALPPDTSLRDLGSHRLKDLQRPEQVYQLVHPALAAEFPPLRSLEGLPNNLPLQLTSFIGRERELADLRRLLGGTRLLMLTGAGGSGKTRLALQLAADLLEEYPDGIWFLDLARLRDPSLVPQTAASALGLVEQPGRPLTDVLAEHLRSRRLLLVLDSCEHLLDACAALSERLLRSCPGVRILGTSRETLNVAGEFAWPVPSLSTPDARRLPPGDRATALAHYEAVRLFIDRAVFAQPGFTVTNQNAPAVAQICYQLDGIPLAIELAAARVKVMSVEQIAARLTDRFRLLTGGSRTAIPRHQTLRAAIDWSYALLSEAERALLQRLSVFGGGWTLEAAEAVCGGDGIEQGEVLDLQARLVEKSLVMVEPGVGGETRYRLLGTIRQYAGERLIESDDAASVRDRHREWFVGLAERGGSELRGPEQGLWLDRLEQEHDNLRAALDWSRVSKNAVEVFLRLAGALYRFWYNRGYMREGTQWLEAALVAGSGAAAAPRARALHGAGYLAWGQGDYDRAQILLEESLALYRELPDKRGLARTLNSLGIVLLPQEGRDDRQPGRACFEEGLLLAREIGALDLILSFLNNLGECARIRGDYGRARVLYAEALERHQKVNDQVRGVALLNLGLVAFAQEDWEAARAFFAESLTICNELGLKGDSAACLEGLAGVHGVAGEPQRAARLLGAAEAVRTAINEPMQPGDRVEYERFIAAARAGLDEQGFAAAWAEGRAVPLERAIELALEEAPTNAQPMTAAGREGSPTPAAEKNGADD